jgi:hypothetical protein
LRAFVESQCQRAVALRVVSAPHGILRTSSLPRAASPSTTEDSRMWDVAYVLITLLFFAAMLWYVAGCERLGGSKESDQTEDRTPSNSRRNGGGN